MTITIALNGKVQEGAGDEYNSLMELAREWRSWAERTESCTFSYSSGMQIVYRDSRYGSVLTAWVDNPSNAVSFQVLEMG